MTEIKIFGKMFWESDLVNICFESVLTRIKYEEILAIELSLSYF